MKWLVMLNGLGVVLVAVFAGQALKSDFAPVYASVAGGLFFLALAIPVLREYGALRGTFRNMEGGFRAHNAKSSGEPEIFTDQRAERYVRRTASPRRVMGLLLIAGAGLFAYDVSGYLAARAVGDQAPPTISNF